MAQPHAVELVVDNSRTKRRRLDDEMRRHLRPRMLYRHAYPLGPGNVSRRSSGTTLAAGVGTALTFALLVHLDALGRAVLPTGSVQIQRRNNNRCLLVHKRENLLISL